MAQGDEQRREERKELLASKYSIRALISNPKLKGLGHAILGNFSTDQMVVELTKI